MMYITDRLLFGLVFITLAALYSGCGGLEKAPDAKAFITPPSLSGCLLTSVQDGNRVFTCPKKVTCSVVITDQGDIISSSC